MGGKFSKFIMQKIPNWGLVIWQELMHKQKVIVLHYPHENCNTHTNLKHGTMENITEKQLPALIYKLSVSNK